MCFVQIAAKIMVDIETQFHCFIMENVGLCCLTVDLNRNINFVEDSSTFLSYELSTLLNFIIMATK